MTDDTFGFPPSFGQEQVWFVDRFHADVPMHNVPVLMRLTGPLDEAALGRAVDGLVARHGALRTRLVSGADGRLTQVVDEPAGARMVAVDLPGGTAVGGDEWLRALASIPFVLDQGPLLRAHLVRVATGGHLLLVVAHAAVFDRRSATVMLAELTALYESEVTGEPPNLAEPVQFTGRAAAERERLRGEVLAGLAGYWRTVLDGFPNLQLPTDRPRPIVADHKGGVRRVELGVELLDGLTELGRREDTAVLDPTPPEPSGRGSATTIAPTPTPTPAPTSFSVVLTAALQVLLSRYTGQDDIVLGVASTGLDSPAEEGPLIGPAATMLPIRTDLSGDPVFTDLLGRVRETVAGACAHRELPFAKLVEELAVERDTGRPPVFQAGLTVETIPDPAEVAGMTVRLERIEHLAARYDLDFFAQVQAGELTVELSYATALFDATTARRMLGNLAVLLAGIVKDPGRRVSELPILTDAELRRELVEWNDTATDLPVVCIHEGFERQVVRAPGAVAAELDGEAVTYAALNAEANQVARYLRGLGVGREVMVGVSMVPSPRRLAVLLGIMKAGGAYVPLDPALPADRLSFMISDTAMPVIVADDVSVPGLPESEAHTVHLDREWPEISALEPGDPGFGARPEDLAYVIYTSGSTGRPKGVMVEHRHAVNFLLGMVAPWRVTSRDRVLQFASLNFDVSVMDMFMTLLAGATAVLTSPETLLSPPRLADLIRDAKITFACLPPAVVALLTGQSFPDLRLLLSAGEELSSELVRKWLRPGLTFYNGYGPTEAAIGAAFCEIDGSVFPPPIGRPKPNYRAYVLDPHLNPVPVGVAGELHVGGAGVTRGYLNAPELTAQRFIDDPFGDGRLYKTGDLVRRMPDGNLVFLGRIDGQVKIRGLRVELGEIETALVAHPAVAQAVVIVAEDRSGEKQLVGYVRYDPDGPPTTVPDLRQHLARRLPAYMVPTHLPVVEAIPLTRNGKVDKARLPAPDIAVEPAAYVAPRTLIETVLADMYAQLLGHDEIGIDDGFFDLGGNSLQAMQLITRLRGDLVVDVDIAAVFLAPTPRQLTVVLRDTHGLEDAELGEDGIDGLTEEAGTARS
jgi:amino acid adenylation domain-containing protein